MNEEDPFGDELVSFLSTDSESIAEHKQIEKIRRQKVKQIEERKDDFETVMKLGT